MKGFSFLISSQMHTKKEAKGAKEFSNDLKWQKFGSI